MSKVQSSAAVLEAPDAKPDTKNVLVTDQDGLIFEDRILKCGTSHDLPSPVANRLASQGRVKVIGRSHFVATTTVIVGTRTYGRGETGTFDGPFPAPLLESGAIVPIESSEAPAVMPPDPEAERNWAIGARVRVATTSEGHLGVPGCYAAAAGDVFTIRESVAVELEVNGKCRILEPLTPVGAEFRDKLARSNGDPFRRPRYVDIAQKHRKAPKPSAGPADEGPLILARSLRPGTFGGKSRDANRMFRLSERAASVAWAAGHLELLENPSVRLRKFGSNYSAFQQNPIQNPFPVY